MNATPGKDEEKRTSYENAPPHPPRCRYEWTTGGRRKGNYNIARGKTRKDMGEPTTSKSLVDKRSPELGREGGKKKTKRPARGDRGCRSPISPPSKGEGTKGITLGKRYLNGKGGGQ